MSEHLFGVSKNRLSEAEVEKRDKIAKRHGCVFVYTRIPGNGPMGWFAGPNRGAPFDAALEERVYADLKRDGIMK